MTRFAALAPLIGATALLTGGCKKPPDDGALVQGTWALVAIDRADGDGTDAQKGLDDMKDVVATVQGDRVTLSHPKEPGTLSATFVLDQKKVPKEIDFFDVVVTGENAPEQKASETTRGIYTLTGDELTLALSLGRGKDLERPTEFKSATDPAKTHGVLVFHLKRK